MPRIQFAPGDQQIEVPAGTSVLDAAVEAGATRVECCGILPACGACRMTVLEGEDNLTPPDALEAATRTERAFLPFERLGCMAHVTGDVVVEMEG
ncbi:MAG: 2Fe-2S iron-sulfur cluster binding domain-containing protein [Deltaproteobacteria bacterium]|nr:2Fe-2S iron-sulfur cluster binding domain-containing protein [Deltaproteobacteria bacterium]